MIEIIPQRFKFSEPSFYDADGNALQIGIDVEISLDVQNADKQKVQKQLETIFEQVLEYFH